MKIKGSYTIDAPRDQVWSALNDMDVLARIVPGCERLEQTGENEYEGTIKIGIQTIKGTYNGKIRLEDIRPPEHYTLVAAGRSANGVVDGTGTVDLAEQDGKTVLTYGGDAQIGGTLASVGQRLIEGASKQLINQSLKALVTQIKARAEPAPAEESSAPTTDTDSAPTALTAEAEQAQPAAAPAAQAEEKQPSDDTSAVTAAVEAAAPTALGAEVEQSQPEPAAPAAEPALFSSQPVPTTFERRAVVVPAQEQLKPEAVVSGMVGDFFSERPWIPWVVVAFLLGLLLGRSWGES